MQYVPTPEAQKKAQLAAKFRMARINIIVAFGFTIINIILALTGSENMFLFSMMGPLLLTRAALNNPGTILVPMLAIVIVGLLAAYVVFWVLSGKRYEWLWGAAVLFGLDTLYMAYLYWNAGLIANGLLDIAFHAYIIYYFVVGLKNGAALKELGDVPEMMEVPKAEGLFTEQQSGVESDTRPLREADMTVKARILVEAQAAGYHIVYRRVKKTNELVIDGKVYGEFEGLIEPAHQVSAAVGGHVIVAVADGRAYCYIIVDGVEVARKMRLI